MEEFRSWEFDIGCEKWIPRDLHRMRCNLDAKSAFYIEKARFYFRGFHGRILSLGIFILDAKIRWHVTSLLCAVTFTAKVYFFSEKVEFCFRRFYGRIWFFCIFILDVKKWEPRDVHLMRCNLEGESAFLPRNIKIDSGAFYPVEAPIR